MENLRRSMKMASENDARLVQLARSGDRTAFGLLYLRHHEAAWRMANAVTAFSSESAGLVVEAFARVLASPRHRFEGDAVLRPALLVCLRQVALERRAGGGVSTSTVHTATVPGNEIVLVEVEPVAAEAFRRLAEPERTAMWLTEIENLTPKEVGAVMGLSPTRAAALAAKGRQDLCAALVGLFATYGDKPCREAAAHVAGVPADDETVGQNVFEHLGRCATCRMRRTEAADVSAALRGAIPPSPLLCRPCQRRWLEQAEACP